METHYRNLNDKVNNHKRIIKSIKVTTRICLALLLVSLPGPVSGQNHIVTRWVTNKGGSARVTNVKADGRGNVYIAGTFNGVVCIENDTLVHAYKGATDIFFAKFTNQGDLLWKKVIGGGWYDGVYDIYVNDSSVFLASGVQYDKIKIEDSIYNNTRENNVIRFNPDGNLQDVSFYGDPGVTMKLVSFGGSKDRLFLATNTQIHEFGNFPDIAKTIKFTTNSWAYIHDCKFLSDNSKIVLGMFNGNLTVKGTTITADLQGSGENAFIFMLNEKDSLLWIKKFGKVHPELRLGVAEDSMVYITASYSNTVNAFGETIYPFSGGYHGMVSALDMDGNLLWNRSFIPRIAGANFTMKGAATTGNDFVMIANLNHGFIYNLEDTVSCASYGNNLVAMIKPSGKLAWSDISDMSGGSNLIDDVDAESEGYIYAVGLTGGGVTIRIGCEDYPSVQGGLFMIMKDGRPDELPVADFSYKEVNNTWFFKAETMNDTLLSWNFDDGSNELFKARNPSHTFLTSGNFNVCLNTWNKCGLTTACKTISIPGLKEMMPARSGNTNLVKAEIHGSGLPEKANFKLVMDGAEDIMLENVQYLDNSRYSVSFRLREAPIGTWDLVMEEGDRYDTLKNAFTTETLNNGGVVTSLITPGAVLRGRFFRYRLAVQNNYNVNIPALPVIVIVSGHHDVFILNSFIYDEATENVHSQLGRRFISYSPPGGEPQQIGFFAIPFVRPGETFYIDLAISSSEPGLNHIQVITGNSLVDMDEDPLEPTCLGSKCADCLLAMAGFIPVAGCAAGVVSLGCTLAYALVDGEISENELIDIGLGLIGGILSCGGGDALQEAAERSVRAILQFLNYAGQATDLYLNTSGAVNACEGKCDFNDFRDFVFNILASSDPNEKYGTEGYSEENYIRPGQFLHYSITFENMDTATAPANEVYILDTLDVQKLDTTSFEWVSFSVGDSVYAMNSKERDYITDVDLRPDKNIILRVEALLDSTGVVSVKFSSLDTLTYELTENILDGFLPPNQVSPEGEGYIQFKITARDDIGQGDEILNSASIIFDYNEAINTGVWKNSIDMIPPVSAMEPLPEIINDTLIRVSWSGYDEHSGISDYDLFMSENEGTFVKILNHGRVEQSFVKVESGNTYGFFVQAYDYTGNAEMKEILAETSIHIDPVSANSKLRSDEIILYPNPVTDILNLVFRDSPQEDFILKITDPAGRLINIYTIQGNEGEIRIDISELVNGIYFLKITNEENSTITRLPFIKIE